MIRRIAIAVACAYAVMLTIWAADTYSVVVRGGKLVGGSAVQARLNTTTTTTTTIPPKTIFVIARVLRITRPQPL